MPTTMADSVVVDAPAAVVWAFVSSPVRVNELVPSTSVTLLSGSFDTVRSRYLVTTKAVGQTIDATHEIVRFEPPRLIEERTTSQGTTSISLVQVEPIGKDRCVLVVQGQIEWGGSSMAMVSRLLNALFGRRTFASYLDGLKRAIESEVHGREDGTSADAEPHLSEKR
jgi:carbon monoxide dehydrogenase subunit G